MVSDTLLSYGMVQVNNHNDGSYQIGTQLLVTCQTDTKQHLYCGSTSAAVNITSSASVQSSGNIGNKHFHTISQYQWCLLTGGTGWSGQCSMTGVHLSPLNSCLCGAEDHSYSLLLFSREVVTYGAILAVTVSDQLNRLFM